MGTRRGNPGLTWKTVAQIPREAMGAAVVLDKGGHGRHPVGRIRGPRDVLTVTLEDRSGRTSTHDLREVERYRVIPTLYEPYDLVLRRGVPVANWRGVVVRAEGVKVLVETLAGTSWLKEDDLMHADDVVAEVAV